MVRGMQGICGFLLIALFTHCKSPTKDSALTSNSTAKDTSGGIVREVLGIPKPSDKTLMELRSRGFKNACFIIIEESGLEPEPLLLFEIYARPSCITVAAHGGKQYVSSEMASDRVASIAIFKTRVKALRRWYDASQRIGIDHLVPNHELYSSDFFINLGQVEFGVSSDGIINKFRID